MQNKRAMELSLNFIVILIISIIIFGFGVRFIYDLASKAAGIHELTASDLDERISQFVCEGSERVCLNIGRKTLKRDEFAVFGVRVINILESQNFDILISPSDPKGYKKDNSPIGDAEPNLIVNPPARTLKIAKNEEASIGFGVQIPSDAVSGTYIINIDVNTLIKRQDGSIGPGLYVPVQKLIIDV